MTYADMIHFEAVYLKRLSQLNRHFGINFSYSLSGDSVIMTHRLLTVQIMPDGAVAITSIKNSDIAYSLATDILAMLNKRVIKG